MRAKFKKGEQKEFIDNVLEKIGCPSFSELINRGVEVSKSSLKNYHSERRVIPLSLVDNLCDISGIRKDSLLFEELKDNWGQVKGGKD